jgi:agmatine/peptidylarginine deiminase
VTDERQGSIAPDYRRPAALMVPHYRSTILTVLEAIAAFAARVIGVVLLSSDPEFTRAFVATQPHPERFGVVTAPVDSPWLRDRSPVAIREGSGYRWAVTRLNPMNRPLDDVLFPRISRPRLDTVPIVLAHGNIVAGPRGVALTTNRVLADNPDADTASLTAAVARLGIRRWIVVRSFAGEMTGHTDVYARFLRPGLLAVAWSETLAEDREVAADLQARVTRALSSIEVLRLPMRSDGRHYASPLNWVQIGRTLLVPRYALTPPDDTQRIARALRAAGFTTEFIASPTEEFGGSLHCLTASLYV